MEWQGAKVVVTGGASGIGLALARRAASLGARVAVVDITTERAEVAAASLPHAAKGYGCDVGNAAAMLALAGSIAADFGGVDAVFANAGVAATGPMENLSPQDAQWIASVNILGPVNTARAFVPLLRLAAAAGQKPRFVITGSEHSLGIPTIGAANMYTASKHAALGVADVLRADLGGSGIEVALLCPGLVATNIHDSAAQRGPEFGGPQALEAGRRARLESYVTRHGQDPDLTAQLCFEGLDRGDFLIITSPHIGSFARPRLAEIERALSIIEQRLPG